MKENLFLKKFRNQEASVGTFFVVGSERLAEAVCYSDLDYLIIDCEHGPFDVESTMRMLPAIELQGKSALVRTRDTSRAAILKLLDIGAHGLIIPQVHTVEEVKKIVEYGKYYPVGQRGVAKGRCGGWGYEPYASTDNMQDFFDYCNENTMLIPQCETMGSLEHIEEIAAIEGVDGIFIGPFDLSVAMGIPAQFDKPEFQAAVARILKATHDAGKLCMIYCNDPETGKKWLEMGFDSVTVGNDVNFYVNAMNDLVKKTKG